MCTNAIGLKNQASIPADKGTVRLTMLTDFHRLFSGADGAARGWQDPERRTGNGLAHRVVILLLHVRDRDLGWLLRGSRARLSRSCDAYDGRVTRLTGSVSMAAWRAAWPAAR